MEGKGLLDNVANNKSVLVASKNILSAWLRPQTVGIWVPIALFVTAIVIRLWGIGTVPVAGDEIGSIAEGTRLTNLHSLAYFLPLSLWLSLGHDATWLRLLTVIPAALVVPISWMWVRHWRDWKVASTAAILILISPMAVEYAREIRFYGIYLFAASLFLWAYVRIIKHPQRAIQRRDWLFLFVSVGLLMVSHLLGGLLVGLVAIHWILCRFPRFTRPAKMITILVFVSASIALIALMISPTLLESAYRIVRALNGSIGEQSYVGGRGLSFLTLGKMALFYQSLAWGQYIYPFNLPLVLPGLLFTGLLGAAGLLRLARDRSKQALLLALVVGGGAVIALYLVFDTLWPAESRDSAAPKYIIFVLPIFMWVLAEGTQIFTNRVVRTALIVGLALVQSIGVVHLYGADWSPTYKAMRLSEPTEAVKQIALQDRTVVLADGRSRGVMEYYLRDTNIAILVAGSDSISKIGTANKVAFTAADDRRELRCLFQPTLNDLAGKREIYSWVNYPFFVYIFDLKESNHGQEIAIPRSLYGLEFADLTLPQQVKWEGQEMTIRGMYAMPDCNGAQTWQAGVSSVNQTNGLALFSNLTSAEEIPDGATVARLTVSTTDGMNYSFDIRKGSETQAWNKACSGPCQAVLAWRKRIALVGASAYPGAYQDFQGKVWGVTLPLPRPGAINSVDIEVLAPDASLNIWGLFMMPSVDK